MTDIKKVIRAYAKFIATSNETPVLDQEPDQYFKSLTEKWLNEEDDYLGRIPLDLLNELPVIEKEEDFVDIVNYIGNQLIVDCPDFLISYLIKSDVGQLAISNILKDDIIKENYEEVYMDKEKRESFETYKQAVLIGANFPSLVDLLINGYEKTHFANEIIHENIAIALGDLKAYEDILTFIDSLPVFEYRHLSISLILLDYEEKKRVYPSLRKAFRKAKENSVKNILAYIFSILGDARAVPMLRKYAIDQVNLAKEKIKNDPNQDPMRMRQDLAGILNAITKLGGNVDDIEKF